MKDDDIILERLKTNGKELNKILNISEDDINNAISELRKNNKPDELVLQSFGLTEQQFNKILSSNKFNINE